MLTAYDAAIEEFIAGRPVPENDNLPEGLRQLIQAITQPINQPFSRELWLFSPIIRLAEVTVPVLIIIGKKDIQVDWQVDGPLFEAVAADHNNIRVIYPENANHVLKYEPKLRSQLTPAEVMVSYGSEDVMLDPDAVEGIVLWLRTQLQAG